MSKAALNFGGIFMPGLNIELGNNNNDDNNNNNNIWCNNLYNYFFFVMKLNLFFYRVLIFVFKRFEVNITLIHDIWRYICVEIFLIQ